MEALLNLATVIGSLHLIGLVIRILESLCYRRPISYAFMMMVNQREARQDLTDWYNRHDTPQHRRKY